MDSTLIGGALIGGALLAALFYFRGKSSSASGSTSGSAAKEEKAEAKVVELHPLTVFFGSQTGTAEGYATRIVDDAKKHGFEAEAMDLEDFETENMADTKLAVFLMATYGEGDPTDNAIEFIQWLKDKDGDLEDDALQNTQFCVFGLGNTQYEHYNSMGKLVNKRMAALGAAPVHNYGEGDDDVSMEDDFDGWYDDFWTSLRKEVLGDESAVAGSGGGAGGGEAEAVELKFSATLMDSAPNSEAQVAAARKRMLGSVKESSIPITSRHFFSSHKVGVASNRELCQNPAAGGSTVHVDVQAPPQGYRTADNLAVCPENEAAIVESVAKWMGFNLDSWFVLEKRDSAPADAKPLFPTPCSVREALTEYCDLTGIPSRRLLGHLSHYAESEKDQKRLAHLASKEGKGDAKVWLTDGKRSLVEVFQAFPSIAMPLGDFMELAPRLQPRWYTIASSSLAAPDRIGLTVSVVDEDKGEGRKHRGVCSTFLSRLQVDEKKARKALREGDEPMYAKVFIQASTFKMPSDPQVPIVMVGPGSGIAPMRAFCQEREHMIQDGTRVGEAMLFFGCRRPNEDFIYKDELEAWTESGAITDLVLAFSRETKQKVYVQHRMRERTADIWRMLSVEGGHFYVCGGTKMGKDVTEELERIATDSGDGGGMSQADAHSFVEQLKDDKRLILELWT